MVVWFSWNNIKSHHFWHTSAHGKTLFNHLMSYCCQQLTCSGILLSWLIAYSLTISLIDLMSMSWYTSLWYMYIMMWYMSWYFCATLEMHIMCHIGLIDRESLAVDVEFLITSHSSMFLIICGLYVQLSVWFGVSSSRMSRWNLKYLAVFPWVTWIPFSEVRSWVFWHLSVDDIWTDYSVWFSCFSSTG